VRFPATGNVTPAVPEMSNPRGGANAVVARHARAAAERLRHRSLAFGSVPLSDVAELLELVMLSALAAAAGRPRIPLDNHLARMSTLRADLGMTDEDVAAEFRELERALADALAEIHATLSIDEPTWGAVADVLRRARPRTAACVRVLVVEDHPAFAFAVESMLEREPDIVVVGVASSAHEAIPRALSADVDVVVMDVGLPGIDGLEATRRVCALRPDARVIVLSGGFGDDPEADARAAGAAAFVTKGDVGDELADEIRRVATAVAR
jgi:CheY-like chemotaxis protein